MKKRIITISSQFGSGGREIAEILSKKLNIPLYNRVLLSQTAKNSGLDISMFENEEAINDYYFFNAFQRSILPLSNSFDTKIFVSLAETVLELAEKESCLFVGQVANSILENREDVLNIYIYSDKEKRLERIKNKYGFPGENTEDYMSTVDRNRKVYLKIFTNQQLGDSKNYHLCMDSGEIGIENCAEIIKNVFELIL